MDENFCPECEHNVGPIWKFHEWPLCGYSEAVDEDELGEEEIFVLLYFVRFIITTMVDWRSK